MMPACVEPLPLYRPRDPQTSHLWRLLDQRFETFQQVYDERFAAKYGFSRPIVERSVKAFLKCGDLHRGFARVRCPDCHHVFVAFSCKQRCTCHSCHQERALLTSIHVAEEVCAPVAPRQVVLTIPKRLRLHTRFDRKLLGKLCTCVWTCLQAEVRRLLGSDDVQPGHASPSSTPPAVSVQRFLGVVPRFPDAAVAATNNPLAFTYPPAPAHRRHGPSGYAAYESYRPGLRDEFAFRCVYCLQRECWGRHTGEFDLDHFLPRVRSTSQVAEYDELVYSCHACNLRKGSAVLPDVQRCLTVETVRVREGRIPGRLDRRCRTAD